MFIQNKERGKNEMTKPISFINLDCQSLNMHLLYLHITSARESYQLILIVPN